VNASAARRRGRPSRTGGLSDARRGPLSRGGAMLPGRARAPAQCDLRLEGMGGLAQWASYRTSRSLGGRTRVSSVRRRSTFTS
jgi:hypothetical protein